MLRMVRLISYNIEYETGNTGHLYEYLKLWRYLLTPHFMDEKIADFLKQEKPDIVALMEVDLGSIRTRFSNKAEFFKEYLNFTSCASATKYPTWSWAKIFARMPIFRRQGNAIIYKKKFEDVKYHWLHEGAKRLLIQTDIMQGSRIITLFLAHLALGKKTRAKQIEEIAALVKEIKTPIILMGDFNTVKGDKELSLFLKKTKLHKTYRIHKVSDCNTYPSFCPRKHFDYFFVSNSINVKDFKTLDCKYSDHLPIMLDFNLK